MPIQLDNFNAATSQIKVYSPKFFSRSLTGSGKKVGVLCEALNPVHHARGLKMTVEHMMPAKRKMTSGTVTTETIPVNSLPYNAWRDMETTRRPAMAYLTEIAADSADPSRKIYIDMLPHSIVLEETDNSASGGSKGHRTIPCYQIFLYQVNDRALEDHTVVAKVSDLRGGKVPAHYLKENHYAQAFTCDPVEDIEKIAKILASNNFLVDLQAIKDFVDTYSIYDAMCRRAEEWQYDIDKTLDVFFANVAAAGMPSPGAAWNKRGIVVEVLHHIENHPIPLDLYRKIYDNLTKRFPADVAKDLCKQNLNLLLSDTLNSLHGNRALLSNVNVTNPKPPRNVNGYAYNPDQARAISSQEPLVLVQSAAGTGKSSTILGRIDWMVDNGVNPEDITVLSFTNAAADHITEKNPNVHSMTIAKMIHTIYSANFSGHALSELETICNSLDIYFPTDDLAMKFKNLCWNVKTNEPNAVVNINLFIEDNYDKVIGFLNAMHQTALELEIIICYQRIDQFVEPPEVQSRFLIIDEVQDNSIFEFIYALKYVDKHRESLFIVGDCSQTLYEFRASNPRALNVLEGSGVFATYQLQINYRSNQEILDFANVALQDIEANQYARLQLQANSLQPVTEQSFTDKVNLRYYRLMKKKDLFDLIPGILKTDLKPYLDACLAKKEQVAFLAHTRAEIATIQKSLEDAYPGVEIANLVPEKSKGSTVFSDFIRRYWGNIKFVPTASIIDIIANELNNHLGDMCKRSTSFNAFAALAGRTLDNWRQEYKTEVLSWQADYQAGRMSLDDFLEHVKESMLDYEIKNNAVRQSVLSAKNSAAKQANQNSDAPFLVSTIHSAKGLEFQNVVLLYKSRSDMPEEDKRMYYVGLTRAMFSEFIVAYDTVKDPKVQRDYDTIVQALHLKAPKPAPQAVPPAGGTAVSGPMYAPVSTAAAAPPDGSAPVPVSPVPDAANAAQDVPEAPVAPVPGGSAQNNDACAAGAPGETVDVQLPPGYAFKGSDGEDHVI